MCERAFGKIGMPHLFNYRKKGKRQTHTTLLLQLMHSPDYQAFFFACLHSTDSNGASPLPCQCIGLYFEAAGNSGLRLSKLSFAETSRSTRSSSFLKKQRKLNIPRADRQVDKWQIYAKCFLLVFHLPFSV